MKLWRRFRFSRLVWILLILAGIGVIFAGIGIVALRHPRFHAFVQNMMRERLGVEARWKSLQWSFSGRLKVMDAQAVYRVDQTQVRVDADVIALSNLFGGRPSADVENAKVAWGAATIASASRISLSWGSDSRARIFLEDAAADPIAFFTAQSEGDEGEPTSIDLAWLDSVWMTKTHLAMPYLDPQDVWDAIVRVHPDGDIVEIDASLLSSRQRNEPLLKIQAETSIRSRSIKKMEASLNRFPAAIAGTAEVSMTADGLLQAESDSSGGYDCKGKLALSEISLSNPFISSLHLPGAEISLRAKVSNRFDLKSATAEIHHAPFEFSDIPGRVFAVPTGIVRLGVEGDERNLFDVELEGFSSLVDQYSLHVSPFPLSASSTWKASFQMKERSIPNLISVLPFDLFSMFEELGGMVEMSGHFEGDRDGMKTFSAEAALKRGQAAYGNMRIENASSALRITGKDWKGRAELWGEMKADLAASGTKTISFEPDFRAIGWFDRNKKEYEFQVDRIGAEIVRDASGWIRSGRRWRLEGEIPLEEGVKSLRGILPEWGKDLEGMGSVRLRLDGSTDFIAGAASSPDFMAYSFSDDYTYGFQWRDVNVNAGYRHAGKPAFQFEIESSTPYLMVGSHEYEWANESLQLHLEAGGNHLACDLQPPGGGIVHLEGNKGDSYSIEAVGLDIHSFLLPILRRFVLDQSDDGFWPFKVGGTANADLSFRWDEGRPRLEGAADLFLKTFETNYVASCMIQNASMRIPVVFPLSYESLNREKAIVSFEKASIDGAEFKDVSFSLPLDSKSIQLISSLSLPMFGGEVLIRDLRVKEWLSQEIELEGSIQLSDVQLEQVNPILPLVPKQGSLSGWIDRIVYTQERIELSGELLFSLFGGVVHVREALIRDVGPQGKLIGFSADMERIDLEKLASYFQYGYITGILSGRMRHIQVIVPPPGAGGWIMPNSLDIELESDPKSEGVISRDTLLNILELSEKTDMNLDQVRISRFGYSQIGLRILQDQTRLRLIGLLDDNLFIAPSKKLFAHKISLRLPDSKKTLDFFDFWERLLDQIGAATP
ncbi:MAG: hypothetical protein JXR73_07150 [Candidatus Omnitrophica bacterium]|nr:hypothetical protein [Candidatus Omnitrophota bacterium]